MENKDRPYEGTYEVVLFRAFVERGLSIPTSDFSQVFFGTGESNCIIWTPIIFFTLLFSPIFAKLSLALSHILISFSICYVFDLNQAQAKLLKWAVPR